MFPRKRIIKWSVYFFNQLDFSKHLLKFFQCLFSIIYLFLPSISKLFQEFIITHTSKFVFSLATFREQISHSFIRFSQATFGHHLLCWMIKLVLILVFKFGLVLRVVLCFVFGFSSSNLLLLFLLCLVSNWGYVHTTLVIKFLFVLNDLSYLIIRLKNIGIFNPEVLLHKFSKVQYCVHKFIL